MKVEGEDNIEVEEEVEVRVRLRLRMRFRRNLRLNMHSKSGPYEKHLYQAHITLQLHWYSYSGIIIEKSTSIHMQLRRFHIRSFACALKLVF